MTKTELMQRLASHKALGAAPPDELEWLATHGTLRELRPGDVLTPKGLTPEGLSVVLSGRVTIGVDRGGGTDTVMEWREGDVTGLLPYSRMAGPPGDSIAQEPTTVLLVHRDHFPDMVRACHAITSALVHSMIDRARIFTSSALHDEKMVSLGKLSAGLAHELNNPAAAIERSASLLEDQLEESERASRVLGASRLTDTQLAAVDAIRLACAAAVTRGVRSPLEHAEREEAIADWLAAHALNVSMAETLADTAVTFEALDAIAASVDGSALDAVLRWAAAGCAVRSLASEIQDAAMRVSGLVTAIKGFTHMDQSSSAAPVDLALGLGNTIAVLRSKARKKSASIAVEVPPDLPRVHGFAGELNQVWANLIDNALDAIPDGGHVDVSAKVALQDVIVRVVDNGTGIPSEILDRIFDPFFTTKPVGSGTGLGLDIVRRLVRHNGGEILVESQPGRTEFRVVLPTLEPKSTPKSTGVTS